MLVVRFGGRVPPPDELAADSVPNTILYPGERSLAPPRVGPCLPWAGCLFYDPILGPRPPTEECLHDGGDRGPRAGIGPDGRLAGLDAEDTVGEYTGADGQRRVVASNRICLCSPRFAVLRSELPLGSYESAVGLLDNARGAGTDAGFAAHAEPAKSPIRGAEVDLEQGAAERNAGRPDAGRPGARGGAGGARPRPWVNAVPRPERPATADGSRADALRAAGGVRPVAEPDAGRERLRAGHRHGGAGPCGGAYGGGERRAGDARLHRDLRRGAAAAAGSAAAADQGARIGTRPSRATW